ncbi:MAG: alkaline phosphatase family protein [Terriglobales bacterium]
MNRLKFGLALFLSMVAASILSGCGSSNSSARGASAAWTVSISQTGSFAPTGVGQYSVIVSNTGNAATTGPANVTETLPSVLAISSVGGTGWTCKVGTPVTCTRSDTLAAGASYPLIFLSVNVSQLASGTIDNSITASGGGAESASGNLQTQIGAILAGKIQHVVILVQDGRTPDNLFQDATLIGRGADIQNYGYTSGGEKVMLASTPLATTYSLANGHSTFLGSCNWVGTSCEMNGADYVQCSGTGCPADNAAYQFVQDASIQPYYTMAETYAFGDRMFQSNEGSSFPSHQYLISGASAVCVPGAQCPILANLASSTSTYFVSDDPSLNARSDGSFWSGCLAPPSSILNLIDTSQAFPNSSYSELIGPECFEHPTLTDVLDANGLSWKYYAADAGSPATAPNAIAHMCQPTGDPNSNSCGGPDWTGANPKVVIEGTSAQIVNDIQGGNLDAVTWVIPSDDNSDQPGTGDGGPAWVTSIVNAIGESSFWSNTAIIVTWGNWGGWYDHVAPLVRTTAPYANSNTYGLRVPLIFISPYAKAQYVSHQYNDFGSILRFVEEMYSLAQVDAKVGYADTYALGDLSDFYDLTQAPLAFTPIGSDSEGSGRGHSGR